MCFVELAKLTGEVGSGLGLGLPSPLSFPPLASTPSCPSECPARLPRAGAGTELRHRPSGLALALPPRLVTLNRRRPSEPPFPIGQVGPCSPAEGLVRSLKCAQPGPGSQPLSPGPLPSLPQKEKIREKFVEALKTEFAGKGLRFSRGRSAPRGEGCEPPPTPQGPNRQGSIRYGPPVFPT